MNRAWQRGAATALLAFLCCLGLAGPARADEEVDVGLTPVLNVQLGTGKLTVQTWDEPRVQIATDGRLNVSHLDPDRVDPRIPRQLHIVSQTVASAHGDVTLPAESFVLPALQGSRHDAVTIRGNGDTTITVPRRTALILAHVRDGRVNLNDYDGVFVAHVRTGGIYLNRVNGSGFVETLGGPVVASNSTFSRLRVRTATGNMLFKGCTSHQIEATSSYGSIVYDNGNFQPGLARFESQHGNVALGVRGGAQIGAHSGSGHIVSNFRGNAQVHASHNTTQATVRGGGPVVTAASKHGSVYLYNGSVRAHPAVRAELRLRAMLPGNPHAPANRPRRAAPPPGRANPPPKRRHPPA